ncbi:MAG: hypothetical protein ABIA91_00030, partial [Patescibacteria group bacterium]
MRNDKNKPRLDNLPKTRKVLGLTKNLPYFNIDDLKGVFKEYYLKIILSRLEDRGKVIRLKKGFYVSEEYINIIERKNFKDSYLEFITGVIYSPSYLSLEYVLAKYNALTESPVNFTCVSKNKTTRFDNKFGNFIYHNIKPALFIGFNVIKTNNLIIYEATKAKALFDYIYLRKNQIVDKRSIDELRINVDVFNKKD